jgi:hypothetical protein
VDDCDIRCVPLYLCAGRLGEAPVFLSPCLNCLLSTANRSCPSHLSTRSSFHSPGRQIGVGRSGWRS